MSYTSYYSIEQEWIEDGDIGSGYFWIVREKSSKKEIGKYVDFRYAHKQAKYKFNKMNKKIERLLDYCI